MAFSGGGLGSFVAVTIDFKSKDWKKYIKFLYQLIYIYRQYVDPQNQDLNLQQFKQSQPVSYKKHETAMNC